MRKMFFILLGAMGQLTLSCEASLKAFLVATNLGVPFVFV